MVFHEALEILNTFIQTLKDKNICIYDEYPDYVLDYFEYDEDSDMIYARTTDFEEAPTKIIFKYDEIMIGAYIEGFKAIINYFRDNNILIHASNDEDYIIDDFNFENGALFLKYKACLYNYKKTS